MQLVSAFLFTPSSQRAYFKALFVACCRVLNEVPQLKGAHSLQWLGYGLDDLGSIPGRGSNRFQIGSGAHPASYHIGTGVLSQGLKRLEREADHSAPSSTETKNAWNYTSSPQYVFMA
jgi:hypothetical protein